MNVLDAVEKLQIWIKNKVEPKIYNSKCQPSFGQTIEDRFLTYSLTHCADVKTHSVATKTPSHLSSTASLVFPKMAATYG